MPSEDIRELMNQLSTPDTWQVRWRAAEALGALGPEAKEALDALGTKVLTDDDHDVRASAVKAIRAILVEDTPALLTELSGFLGNNAPPVRQQAAEALAELGSQAVDALDELRDIVFNDEYAEVRASAFEAIKSIGGEVEIDPLIRDAPPTTAGSILLSFAPGLLARKWASDKEAVLPVILAALEHQDWMVRQKAADWLGMVADEIPEGSYAQVFQALQGRRLVDDDSDVVSSVREALDALREQQEKQKGDPQKFLEMLKSEIEKEQVSGAMDLVRLAKERGEEGRDLLPPVINKWIEWIACDNRREDVDDVANAMRSSHLTVFPLVDLLEKTWQPSPELKTKILNQAPDPDEFKLLKAVRDGGKLSKTQEDQLTKWLASLADKSDEFARLKRENKTKEMVDWFEEKALKDRELLIHRRIVGQLADMSDYERFFEGKLDFDKDYKKSFWKQLEKHAVPVLGRRLLKEEDEDLRASMARTLGNISGREAVEALTQAVVGEERKQDRRQKLLNKYYLEPSNRRGEEAAQMLKEALNEAKRTLRILQWLNIAVFAVGLSAITIGLLMILRGEGDPKAQATQVVGGLSSLGGLAGVLTLLVRDPLDRIQNAMSNLVQLEAAFTSFVWELNLNSTYIQSQYVAKGELSDDDIGCTVGRIEDAMSLALNLVQTYTEAGGQRIVTRIHSLFPASDKAESTITIYGQHLQGDSLQKKERKGLIAINHTPIPVQPEHVSWKDNEVQFKLPAKLPDLKEDEGTIWVSLFIDGMETNALPFHVMKETVGEAEAAAAKEAVAEEAVAKEAVAEEAVAKEAAAKEATAKEAAAKETTSAEGGERPR